VKYTIKRNKILSIEEEKKKLKVNLNIKDRKKGKQTFVLKANICKSLVFND
jgi:hypothetical protein